MTGNYLPWLALAGIVAASLVLKGYVKMPSFHQPSSPVAYSPPLDAVSHSTLVDHLDSYTLGIAFAKAKRAEAEHEIAHLIAIQAGEQIKATFTAPFSVPAPAGQDPNQAGVKP